MCEPVRRDYSVHDHRGFLARLRTGFGIDSIRLDADSSSRSAKDAAAGLGASLDLGGALIPNLILRGRAAFWASAVRDSPFAYDRGGFAFGLLGAGLDYYVMPANIYFGGTLGVAGASFVEEYRHRYGDTRHSKAGLGVELDAGKEWWLASELAIGVAVRATYISVSSANMFRDYIDGRLHVLHLSLDLSITYN